MAVDVRDIHWLGSLNMQETDTGTQGGNVDTGTKVVFKDVDTTDGVRAVTESAAHTDTIDLDGRTGSGALVTASIVLTNRTQTAESATQFERLIKANIATRTVLTAAVGIYSVSNQQTGDISSATSNTCVLSAVQTPSAVDDFYNGWCLIGFNGDINASPANVEVREVLDYAGASRTVSVRPWTTTPTSVWDYIIAPGMVLESSGTAPAGQDTVTRPFYNVAADVSGGSQRTYYEKICAYNNHASLDLTTATITELNTAGTLFAEVDYALETTLGATTTSTNRITVPASGIGAFQTASNVAENVANAQNLSFTNFQGVWLRLTLAAGALAQNKTYELQLKGQSV